MRGAHRRDGPGGRRTPLPHGYRPDGTEPRTASHAATPDSLSAAHLDEAAQDVGARVVAELLAAGAADLAPLGGAR